MRGRGRSGVPDCVHLFQRNDVEMLQWAARGVAMGNAPEEVKAVADEVTADVYDDGLVLVLNSLPGMDAGRELVRP